MSRVVAIHQPNFFPWLGYFDKIARADVFVFLDDVDYPRAGSGGMGSWVNRVKVAIRDETHWIGAPLRRYDGTRRIREVEIADGQPWRDKLLQTLQINYRKATQFGVAMPLIERLIRNPEARLSEFNISAISAIADHLRLRSRFVRQSEIGASGKATELLVNLTKAVGGEAYLCGGGAGGYQEDALFPAAGVQLIPQNFTPTTYGPPERFQPGLSVIDYLMWDGRPYEPSQVIHHVAV